MTGIALESKQEAHVVQSLCFSFTIRDLNLLLIYYSASFFLYRELIRRDYTECCLIGLVALLSLLFILSVQDLCETIKNNEEDESRKKETLIAKKIRTEYQHVYKNNRKKELLIKTNNSNELTTNSEPSTNTCKTVHFNYLDRHNTTRSHFKDL